MSGEDYMDRLRREVRQVIGGNAVVLARHGVARAPEKQLWNISAKKAAARQIAEEMKQTHPGWNNAGDAGRHAEWSRRMSERIGPIASWGVGIGHELEGMLPSEKDAKRYPKYVQDRLSRYDGRSQSIPEAVMDLKNNAEGLRAARQGRAVDPRNLQVRPVSNSEYLRGSR